MARVPKSVSTSGKGELPRGRHHRRGYEKCSYALHALWEGNLRSRLRVGGYRYGDGWCSAPREHRELVGLAVAMATYIKRRTLRWTSPCRSAPVLLLRLGC